MIERQLSHILKNRLKKFPILTLTGPRQSGKSTLLKNYFPDYEYINLERLDYRHLILNDPIGFLKSQEKSIIFDEAQQVPELFNYLQVVSDEKNRAGQYILSSSQSFLMNERISQSLAGRTSINHLFPFDISEIGLRKTVFDTIYTGFYPRMYDFNIEPEEFYPPYIQTYIERDVRTLRSVENLTTFTRFLALCAGRIGQTLNLTSLANDAGVSVNTAKSWLSLLEASFILFQLQPYYKNFNKRLIKSPKIYFYDTGVVCSLLNIQSAKMIQSHYLYGALFENFVIAEIIKLQSHKGHSRKNTFYWRDNNGVEIDCILEGTDRKLHLIEIKGGATINKDYMKNLKSFPIKGMEVEKHIIYTGDNSLTIGEVEITGWNELKEVLEQLAEK
ncbi:MAG TPA: ATP-binding protein [Salinivirgaceae bacterium]|nr:ATP-binding protein [Salinivirgaceae bacterium]